MSVKYNKGKDNASKQTPPLKNKHHLTDACLLLLEFALRPSVFRFLLAFKLGDLDPI